ncbi:DUF4126 domain-containing protein [Nocardia sp. NEAU-G5]|uniref:DUF4126 domain-containing protein n=1 Tax=Nocardia albiluteola TaxID=2842303 RepID=A0ABS6B9P4_9NOCA|nr:DUF4126 family protein [Nocardia albiluteola]MBU3067023.1 DUF4126 domain-containing protein [Nocardia albiluteola]
MTYALVLLLALLIGVVAGLRAFTAPGVVAWGARLGWLPVAHTWAGWVAHLVTAIVLTILLVVELITDQLPSTPPRTVPSQFGARIITGAFAGAVVGAGWHHTFAALICGVVGAVIGTLGGYRARRGLVERTGGRDLPVALAEDVLAVGGGFVIVALAMNL